MDTYNVFLCQIFTTLQQKKKGLATCSKNFLKKTQSCHILRKQKLNLPYLKPQELYVARIRQGF
jgi:hypothetical protein